MIHISQAPSSNNFDQSESLFYFIPAITPPYLCVYYSTIAVVHTSTTVATEYIQHRQ